MEVSRPELFQCTGYAGVLRITAVACLSRRKAADKGRLDYPNTKACLCCPRHPEHQANRAAYRQARETMDFEEEHAKRHDGLCPLCGVSPRRQYASGSMGAYCAACEKRRQRVRNILQSLEEPL